VDPEHRGSEREGRAGATEPGSRGSGRAGFLLESDPVSERRRSIAHMRLASAVALALLCLAGAAVRADDVSDARAALRAGDRAAALAAVERHLAAKPGDAEGRFLKGVILSELGRSADAFDVFFLLTQDYPELPEPYNNLAVLYAARGEYERARANLEMAIRANPAYATAYENLGDVHARLSVQAYEKAAQLDAANRRAGEKLALARELAEYVPRRSASGSR
jgi:Flp pilus assembly protein TadD